MSGYTALVSLSQIDPRLHVPATEFPRFQALPVELRLVIWRFALFSADGPESQRTLYAHPSTRRWPWEASNTATSAPQAVASTLPDGRQRYFDNVADVQCFETSHAWPYCIPARRAVSQVNIEARKEAVKIDPLAQSMLYFAIGPARAFSVVDDAPHPHDEPTPHNDNGLSFTYRDNHISCSLDLSLKAGQPVDTLYLESVVEVIAFDIRLWRGNRMLTQTQNRYHWRDFFKQWLPNFVNLKQIVLVYDGYPRKKKDGRLTRAWRLKDYEFEKGGPNSNYWLTGVIKEELKEVKMQNEGWEPEVLVKELDLLRLVPREN